jgi:two-component system OmpR family sensor kinase
VVEIGQSLGWRLEEIMEAAQAFLLLIVPLLLLVTWVIVMTLRAGLNPVFGFTEGVRRRSPEDLSALPVAGLPQELRIMAEALNGYLKRIGDLRQAERAFIANAAHELRTPLAVIRSRLQLLAEGATGAPTVPEIMSSVDMMSRRVERLLQLERAESGIGLARQRVDLVALVRLVCRETGLRNGTIVFDDGDHERYPIDSDPDALAIILRNLLDNALEHGTGGVSVRLTQDGRLVIRNPVSGRADFRTGRFSKAQGSGGAGLGLDIVRRLCADLRIPLRFLAADTSAQVELQFGQALDTEGDIGAPS